jgi:hypothetical protein
MVQSAELPVPLEALSNLLTYEANPRYQTKNGPPGGAHFHCEIEKV